MKFTYTPRNVCSRRFDFDIENGVIEDVKISGGCNGNLKGISALIKGMSVSDVIDRLKGTDCNGRGTSCPDQIARALEQFSTENA